jgi:hypothetical protein
MAKKLGWDKMDVEKRAEALKIDLDQLYDKFAAHERTMKQLIEHIDRNFRRLDAGISELRQSLPGT